jgi:hypothetical protein
MIITEPFDPVTLVYRAQDGIRIERGGLTSFGRCTQEQIELPYDLAEEVAHLVLRLVAEGKA